MNLVVTGKILYQYNPMRGGHSDSPEYDDLKIQIDVPDEWKDSKGMIKPDMIARLHKRRVSVTITNEAMEHDK